jgi:hypothetical protein
MEKLRNGGPHRKNGQLKYREILNQFHNSDAEARPKPPEELTEYPPEERTEEK